MMTRIQLKSLLSASADHRCAQGNEISRDIRRSDADIDRFPFGEDIRWDIHRHNQLQLINTQRQCLSSEKQITPTGREGWLETKSICTVCSGTILNRPLITENERRRAIPLDDRTDGEILISVKVNQFSRATTSSLLRSNLFFESNLDLFQNIEHLIRAVWTSLEMSLSPTQADRMERIFRHHQHGDSKGIAQGSSCRFCSSLF